jgi:hypothetical protein
MKSCARGAVMIELRLLDVGVDLRLERKGAVGVLVAQDVLIRHGRVEGDPSVQLLMFIARRDAGRRRHCRVIVHRITSGVVLVLRQEELVFTVRRGALASGRGGQRAHSDLSISGIVPGGTTGPTRCTGNTVNVGSNHALSVGVELPQERGGGQRSLLLQLLVVGSDPLDRGPLLLLEEGVSAEVCGLVCRRLARWQVLGHRVFQVFNGRAAGPGLLQVLRTGPGGVRRDGVCADRVAGRGGTHHSVPVRRRLLLLVVVVGRGGFALGCSPRRDRFPLVCGGRLQLGDWNVLQATSSQIAGLFDRTASATRSGARRVLHVLRRVLGRIRRTSAVSAILPQNQINTIFKYNV